MQSGGLAWIQVEEKGSRDNRMKWKLVWRYGFRELIKCRRLLGDIMHDDRV
jgi:hypothetical protein